MTGLYHQEFLLFYSTIFLSIYYITMDRFKHTIHLYFWIYILSYIALVSTYWLLPSLFNIQSDQAAALGTIVSDMSLVNIPLYIVSAICLGLSMKILEKFITNYSIMTVIAAGQFSLLISTIIHNIFHDPLPTSYTIGAIIIGIGGIIIGLPNFSLNHPIKSFSRYDKKLIQLALFYALLISIIDLISQICTASYDPFTKKILDEITKHTHTIPFTAISPIFFNIGLQLANIIVFYLYIKFFDKKDQNQSFIGYLKKNFKPIIFISLCYYANILLYYVSYENIHDKNIFAAIARLYIPITLLLSYLFFNIKLKEQYFIGIGIIALGTIIMILYA